MCTHGTNVVIFGYTINHFWVTTSTNAVFQKVSVHVSNNQGKDSLTFLEKKTFLV